MFQGKYAVMSEKVEVLKESKVITEIPHQQDVCEISVFIQNRISRELPCGFAE